MLDIMDYVLSPTTTTQKIAYVAVLVEDFLVEFSRIYDCPLVPKMHYLVHIPCLDDQVNSYHNVICTITSTTNALANTNVLISHLKVLAPSECFQVCHRLIMLVHIYHTGTSFL